MVYPALLPLMRTARLPVVDWTDAPADLNGLVRFAERRNLVYACVPSHFKRSLPQTCLGRRTAEGKATKSKVLKPYSLLGKKMILQQVLFTKTSKHCLPGSHRQNSPLFNLSLRCLILTPTKRDQLSKIWKQNASVLTSATCNDEAYER